MRYFFLLFSISLLCIETEYDMNVCSVNNIDKIIISHIGMEDKPLPTIQISYKKFGGNRNPKQTQLFYYGTTYNDSIKWPIIYSDNISLNNYDSIKSITENYPNKYNHESCLPEAFAYGNYCISIVEKGNIKKLYFSRLDAIKLLDEYIYILIKDPNAEYVVRRLEANCKRMRK